MATLTTTFRAMVGDTSSIPSTTVLSYLDLGIEKLSQIADNRVIENVVITATDITNKYKDVSKNIVSIYSFALGTEDYNWKIDKDNRIKLLEDVQEGTYEIDYRAKFVKLDGVDKDDALLDYPRQAELGIAYYAVAKYQQNAGITKIDGTRLAVASKSEEGMSVSYGVSSSIDGIGSPKELEKVAIEIFRGLSSQSNLFISVQI